MAPDTVGEVIVSIRGGKEAFYAHPWDDKEVINEGATVVVVSYLPPRTVRVTAFSG